MVTVVWSVAVALRWSAAIRVKVAVVFEPASGAVNEGEGVSAPVIRVSRVESWVHEQVGVSSEPSWIVLSAAAVILALALSGMATIIVSEVAAVPSVTLRVNSTAVAPMTSGTVNEGMAYRIRSSG